MWELRSARGVKLNLAMSSSIFSHLLSSLFSSFVSVLSVHGSEWFGVGGRRLDIHNLRNDIHVTVRRVKIPCIDLRISVYRIWVVGVVFSLVWLFRDWVLSSIFNIYIACIRSHRYTLTSIVYISNLQNIIFRGLVAILSNPSTPFF